MVQVSGFTIVRNAIKLDFPLEASIRSILPVCDEVVVNVGRSEDQTLDLVRSIRDPKIRILETEWDMGAEGRRAVETHYNWDRVAADVIRIGREVAARRTPPLAC